MPGGLGPWEEETVTVVDVLLGVLDAVNVAVDVAVFTKVLMAVEVGVLVIVKV